MTVFAAGQAHHDAIVGINHGKIGNGLSNQTTQALLQLVGFKNCASRIRFFAGGHKYILEWLREFYQQLRRYGAYGKIHRFAAIRKI